MRDKWRDKNYFEELILEIHEVYKDGISGKEENCYIQSIASIALLACARIAYSKGDSFDEVKQRYDFFLKHLLQSEECYQKDEERESLLKNTRFVSSTIVYGECLGYDYATLQIMAKCIPAGKEQLVDRLLSAYQPDRPISTYLDEARKYKQLIAILDSDNKAQQAKKLKSYLDQWPKKLGLRAPDGLKPLHTTPTYDGYWCYEAAAVVIVCGIDDESFRDHEYYPGELMSWRNAPWAASEGAVATATPPEARHAQNLSRLKPAGFKTAPAALAGCKPFFDTICAHLPEALRHYLWNTLVDDVWEEYQEYGFLDALSEAVSTTRLADEYGYRCLMHVDWKDLKAPRHLYRI
jgi:hypothetical protein